MFVLKSLPLLLLAVLPCLGNRAVKVCPPGWTKLKNTCYKVGETGHAYDAAKIYCRTQGAQLVHTRTKEEKKYVSQVMQTSNVKSVWIGLRKDEDYYFDDWSWESSRWMLDENNLEEQFWDADVETEYGCAEKRQNDGNYLRFTDCDDSSSGRAAMCSRGVVKEYCEDGSCYQLYNTQSLQSALQTCEVSGMHIVEINSEEEQKLVEKILDRIHLINIYMDENVWIGASDEGAKQNKFYWRSNKQTLKYSNWRLLEPNNAGPYGLDENCAVLGGYGDRIWNDVVCSGEHAVLCERNE